MLRLYKTHTVAIELIYETQLKQPNQTKILHFCLLSEAWPSKHRARCIWRSFRWTRRGAHSNWAAVSTNGDEFSLQQEATNSILLLSALICNETRRLYVWCEFEILSHRSWGYDNCFKIKHSARQQRSLHVDLAEWLESTCSCAFLD